MCINILTWNIKAGQNKDGSYPIIRTKNLDRIANIISDFKVSIVCLQEVDVYTLRAGIMIHQAKYISNRLTSATGKPWSYEYIASRNMNPGFYGNAILSCYPMTTALKVYLPRINSKEDRSFLLTNIDLGNFSIYVGTFHLGLQGDQVFHAQQIKDVLNNNNYFNKKIIIGGDLNAQEGTDAYYIMLNEIFPMIDVRPMGICTLNCYEDYNNPKIDFFFIRGLSTCSLRSRVLPVDISDHRPIILYQI